ncbi:hypothetical protein GLOIN_2v1886499 [Rhizophagus irregularis DAOM 181602=DAOM 197198]|nr:hypothetical protein GLOIN_2v1886499 [Rhizophagus irregularis DAOM 181602=DAOM 197198]
MSFKRRGCILHQKLINLFQYKNGTDHIIDTYPNNKTFHATHLFNHWKKKTIKHIYSQRLGISYNSQYFANNVKRICSLERRIARRDSQVPADNIIDQLHRSRQHRFLFLPSQYVYKLLQHLKYQRNLRLNDNQNYKFPIPLRAIKPKKLKLKRPITPVTPLQNIPQEMLEEITNTHDLPAITIQSIPFDDRNTWHDKLERKSLAERNAEHDNYINTLSTRAKLWGTSFNSIEHREEQLELEFAQFKIDYFSVMNSSADHYRYKSHTSDDTKELELRPCKHPDNMSLDNIKQIGSIKKL